MNTETVKSAQPEVASMDDLLVTLLAEGWTHQRVASFCDISTKTIQRRMNDAAFSEKVSVRKRERLTEITLRITRITDSALDVLEDAMKDDDVKVRMRAAKTALDYQERYHRRAVFEADADQRIAALEEGVADLYGQGDRQSAGDPSIKSLELVALDLADATSIEAVGVADDLR